MLIIVNPYATTVSDRLKNLVVYALQGRYEVEAVSTEAQHHATEIGREAREGGYDIVVAFGGDGTLNEVANGLAGTDVPVSVLPGGSTNVVCRTLGIPNDVVDATEHLLGLADDLRPRKIDLGLANGRHFVFACGAGLDATAARQVDSHPRMKARGGRWYYTWAAISGFYRSYLRNPVRMRLEAGSTSAEGVTAIAQNSDPFTYFGNQPLRICENAALDNGTLSVAILRRATQRDVPTIAARVLIDGLRTPKHRQIDHLDGVTECRLESRSHDAGGRIRPFPVQVDGDYIGDHSEVDIGIAPAALTVIA
jgi:diacylglycerol kinase family enzyme